MLTIQSTLMQKDILVGGVDIEMSKPNETQIQEVQGQGSILSEKKRSAKWY
jgi:hypothetical protein